MTEKLLTFPSPTSQDLVDGVNSQNSTFFQNSNNTNQQIHSYQDNMRGSRIFFVRGRGGPGSSTYFTVYRGGPMVLLHIFQGGSNFFQGGGGGVQMLISIETHVTITCDFPGGSELPIPLWIRKCTIWHFGTNRLKRACAASF